MNPIIANPDSSTPAGSTCPSWCAGRHGSPLLPGEPPGHRHIQASCPPWCCGHPEWMGPEGDHSGPEAKVTLSRAPRIEDCFYTGPDWLGVSVWSVAGQAAGAPYVAVMHGADDGWLPELTPDEAEALAVALVAKARDARLNDPGARGVRVTGPDCPPWCAYGPHEAGDDVHMSEGHAVPVTEDTFCSYERARKAGRTEVACTEENCAELVNGDDGYPVVSVHHGDDCLPHMTLQAAEEFAMDILGLVATGREARETQQGDAS